LRGGARAVRREGRWLRSMFQNVESACYVCSTAAIVVGSALLLVNVDDRRTTRVTMRAALLGLSASR